MICYPKVSIIILNWNGKEETIECLESLKQIDYLNYEIILVDNGSTDGSVELVSRNYCNVQIIENGTNLGYAEGNNVGIRQAIKNKSDYVLLLNNDTVVDPNFLCKLVDVAESDVQIGIVGPSVYNYNDRSSIQSRGAKLCMYTGVATLLKGNEAGNDGTLDAITSVDYVSGCAFLAKCKLFDEIGYLCKDYFAYREEAEWCIRAKKASYKVLCVSKSKIWHKGHATSGRISGFEEYHMTRNTIWFMKQHATKLQYSLFLFYFFGFKLWFKCGMIFISHHNLNIIGKLFKGVIDGFRNNVTCQK